MRIYVCNYVCFARMRTTIPSRIHINLVLDFGLMHAELFG
jgi:hypothetical protein